MENWRSAYNLDGKTVLVTGASSGIGKQIAIACSNMGASIILNGRDREKLNVTLAALYGNNHVIISADLTEFNSISETVNQMPIMDGIVLCAGISERMLAKQLSEEDIDRTMNINFKAPVILISEILKQKKINKNGSIVLIASLGADSPSIGNGIYSASKAALISYARCLMLELAPRQIRVNCISPGMVWTDLILDSFVTVEQLKENEQTYPLKRYGQPNDIAGLAIYLLSDISQWMTGSNIKITGGA